MESKQDPSSPSSIKEAFTGKATHPLVLNLLMLDKFGPSYLAWEPETCWFEANRTFDVRISDNARTKIQAVRTCYVSDVPYEQWQVFEYMCSAFFGVTPKFDMIQKPTSGRAAVTLDIMSMIKEKKEPAPEIYKYCTAVLLDDGIVYGPGPLEPCNEYLKKIVPEALHERTKDAVRRGVTPTFDGLNDADVQIMKASSIRDFIAATNAELLSQVKTLLK